VRAGYSAGGASEVSLFGASGEGGTCTDGPENGQLLVTESQEQARAERPEEEKQDH